MPIQCSPQLVQETYQEHRSWRKVAKVLNAVFGVALSHATWRDYGTGSHDIADPYVRECLRLAPRPCPTCGRLPNSKNRKTRKRLHIPSYGYPRESLLSFEKKFEQRDPSK